LNLGEEPKDYVTRMSDSKCRVISEKFPDHIVLGADTVVVLDSEIIGKPKDEEDAMEILSRLSDRQHSVFTGITLRHSQSSRLITESVETLVKFAKLSSEEISSYVSTGSPLDKAGAYGIQDDLGSLYVDSIQGDYYNVVGLPLRTFYICLKEHFPEFELISTSHISSVN